MRIGCVGEGMTEYSCLPTIVSGLGHIVVGNVSCNGCYDDWEQTIRQKVIPRVFGMAVKNPDKIIVALDREDRDECCPDLAQIALNLIGEALRSKNLTCSVALIIADRTFETILFADYESVDKMTILTNPISHLFGESTDGVNVLARVRAHLKAGQRYDKIIHGKRLAQRLILADPVVLAGRNRSLRKLLKEIPRELVGG